MNNTYFTQILSDPDTWVEWAIELDAASDAGKWRKFLGEQRVGEKPDFSVINGVVFEVGRAFPGKRPGDGHGAIEIGPLWLSSSKAEPSNVG